jgi:hypothetical protein
MKKILYIIVLALSPIIYGCTEGFEDINTNKHEFVEVGPEYLLASSVKGSINLIAELNANMYWQYSHHFAVSSMASTASYGASYSNINSWWARFYQNISLLRKIQNVYGNKPGYENRVQMAKIWESYMFYIFTTTFGGVPYKDACREDLTNIPFDKEEDIYKGILNTLETASKTLDTAKDKLEPDILFPDSDITKWKKFAVALRLKIALETQNAIPAESATHGKDVVTNFENYLLKSNAENLTFKWGGTNSTENSYYFDTYLLSQTKDLPALNHLMFVYMRSYPDPRMQAIFDKVQGHYLIYDTLYTDYTRLHRNVYRYEIPYNGRPKTTQYGRLDDNEGFIDDGRDPYRSMSSNQYSYLKTDYLKADAVQNLIWYSDICFMQAEAKLLGWGGSKSVDTYYYDGITASFTQFGLSSSQATTYKSLNGIKWNTEEMHAFPDYRNMVSSNIPNDPLHKIIVQRWIAGIFYGSHDAYNYIRRTRKIDLAPHLAATTDANGTGSIIANLPERLQYPNTEISYNSISYKAAVQNLNGGSDLLSSYLKLSKEYNRKTYDQWQVFVLKLNNRCWTKWYGDTERDLVNAGLIINQTYFIQTVLE